MDLNNRQVLLTGASSGIGFALAMRLLQMGAIVHGVARSARTFESLSKMFPMTFTYSLADIAKKESWQRIQSECGFVPEILILNAGNCEYMDKGKIDSDLVRRIFEVNFFANIYAGETFLEAIEEKGNGQLVLISSCAAYLPLPNAEAYGASKAALNHFFKAIQVSCKKTNICIINPGFVKTPLTDKNTFPMPMMITPEEAAQHIVRAIISKKSVVFFPKVFSFILRGIALLPSSLRLKVARRFFV